MAHAFRLRRLDLYTQFERPIMPDELAAFKALVLRRSKKREPLAYITGEREFWGLSLRVTPAVLIPRQETEHLVEAALKRLSTFPNHSEARVIDIGTGSGAISLALLHELPTLRVTATDISADAIAIASENAQKLGLRDRLTLYHGDLLPPGPAARFDFILSNPPYIAPDEAPSLSPEVHHHEPHAALFAPENGLAIIRRLITQSATALCPGGWLLFEIGSSQGAAACALMRDAGFLHVETIKDYARHDRIICGQRPLPDQGSSP